MGEPFTGDLAVDPAHLRDFQRSEPPVVESDTVPAVDPSAERVAGSDRARRIRDAVEACLSDILLLGTEEQVRRPNEQYERWCPDILCTCTISLFRCETSSAKLCISLLYRPTLRSPARPGQAVRHQCARQKRARRRDCWRRRKRWR
ncbi:hypothetical protein MESS2_1360005 [Mesorhizobium metallidurans STM 2683]|uniref:Uncharacterized protein n=1 Tax=Mesorhizobium metallidurans STM 2683 TaxID=1297569 RepID=M5EKG4_9HYPH|nr:hypothetical protein MESS2_1360005 [Mesorhizobium metallidurans STM 2683]